MKTLKKLFSVLAVVAMILTMSVNANAATVSVTDESTLTNHTYKIYQILKGNMADGKTLTDVEWADSFTKGTDLLNALKADADLDEFFTAEVDTAAEFAKVLSDNATNEGLAKAVAKAIDPFVTTLTAAATITTGTPSAELAVGYYLITDETTLNVAGDARNASLLQVVDADAKITIGAKTTKPSISKLVEGKEQYNAYMGEDLEMELVATIPSMEYYDTYKVVLTDAAADGFEAPSASDVTIKLVQAGKTDVPVSVTPVITDNDFTITINDVKALAVAGSLDPNASINVVVTYTTELKDNAVLGTTGNVNQITLTYSADPNSTDTNTSQDSVTVFTYAIDGTKVNGDNTTETLEGAKFIIKKGSDYATITNGVFTGWTTVEDDAAVLITGEDGKFAVKGLIPGDYTLVEKEAPQGYNKIADTPFEIVGDEENGTLVLQVKNYKGATLPETGGIGTTMFYVIGAALVIGAGVVLVSKKRMATK